MKSKLVATGGVESVLPVVVGGTWRGALWLEGDFAQLNLVAQIGGIVAGGGG